MDRYEFLEILHELRLAPSAAAELLGYDQRTVRRWKERDASVPAAAAAALRAWRNLHRIRLPWRPDALFLSRLSEEEADDQIHLYREHTLDLNETLQRVKQRGGPASAWKVDLPLNVAELGDMQVHFYRLQAGGFSVASYSRSEKTADLQRDRPLIEDAVSCIAEAIADESTERERVQFVSETQAIKSGLYGTQRVLQVDIERALDQPGYISVEGSVSEPPTNDSESWTAELRPQIGTLSWRRLEEAVRRRALEMGIRYVVLKPDNMLNLLR